MKKFTTLLLSATLASPLCAQVDFSEASNLIQNQWTSSHPVAIVDINGDDLDDIVILDGGTDLVINFQNATGQTYTEYVYPGGGVSDAWGMCAGDIDNDGYADIVHGGVYDDVKLVRTNTVETDYSTSMVGIQLFLQGINFADIDNDGNLDIFACDDVGPSQIFLGDGAGGFTFNNTLLVTNLNGGGEDDSGNYGSVWTDVDNDGDIDLYISKCRQGVIDPADPRRINLLYINNGTSYSEEGASWGVNSGEQTWSADFGDIDNDGDMDLLLGQHTGDAIELFLNDGNGNFTNATVAAGLENAFGGYVIQSKFADFDNDGWIDILVSGANIYYFGWNNGDGTFSSSNQPNIGCEINSFALGDLNNDGFMDMYATPFGYGAWNPSTGDSVYLNDGNSNNYAVFSLNGIISNPDAVGARVSIYGPWGVQMREVRSGESYGIQNTFNLHFGLGTETEMDSVVINWPSGQVDVHYNVPMGDHTYTEGSIASIDDIDAIELTSKVFPNPADDQTMITVDGLEAMNETVNLVLFDVRGQQVRVMENLTANNTIITKDELAAGLYFYELQSQSGTLSTGKLIFR